MRRKLGLPTNTRDADQVLLTGTGKDIRFKEGAGARGGRERGGGHLLKDSPAPLWGHQAVGWRFA
eukprot:5000204-Pyramimonas_sp.AAC.1